MGTHPDGPAKVRNSSECLSKMLARKNKNNFFSNLKKVEDIHLPFIMKIMSIKHTLSLQVHPTKVIYLIKIFFFIVCCLNLI